MGVGDISVGALDPPREVRSNEQVEDAIDAVRRDPLAPCLGDRLGDVIGAGRPVESGKGVKHRRAHVGPLLAALYHPPRRGVAKRIALMKLVGMC